MSSRLLETKHENLPAGRRFHSRTFSKWVLSTPPPFLRTKVFYFLNMQLSKIAYPPWILKEKTAVSRQVKSLSEISYYDANSFPRLINTYRPFYRKKNISQAFGLDKWGVVH